MNNAVGVEQLSDDELLQRTNELAVRGRRIEAALIAHMGEVDRRKLYRGEACSSMFAYATRRLRLSESQAYDRITVARTSRNFPVLLEMLADGRLTLTAASKLGPHLKPENATALLARAVHATRRQVEAIVAEVAPQPDVRSSLRRLPPPRRMPGLEPLHTEVPEVRAGGGAERRSAEFAEVRAGAGEERRSAEVAEVRPGGGEERRSAEVAEVRPGGAAERRSAEVAEVRPGAAERQPAEFAEVRPAGPAMGSDRSSVVPIAPARYRVQFTAGAELEAKIARARALLRHKIPSGDVGVIVDEAMTVLLAKLERTRCAAAERPRANAPTVSPSRHVPAAVRRAVWERDEGRCTFVDRVGRRCEARDWLEIHHCEPFGRGGETSAENLRLLCRVHNQYQAELDYGRDFMAGRRRDTSSRACEPSASFARLRGRAVASPHGRELRVRRGGRALEEEVGGERCPEGDVDGDEPVGPVAGVGRALAAIPLHARPLATGEEADVFGERYAGAGCVDGPAGWRATASRILESDPELVAFAEEADAIGRREVGKVVG
jgi:hypothetical protein